MKPMYVPLVVFTARRGSDVLVENCAEASPSRERSIGKRMVVAQL